MICGSIVLLASCTMDMGGGISDHPNERVAGVVLDRDGNPAAGVTVTLLPDDYNHITDSATVDERVAVTDADGRYMFDSLREGCYALQADKRESGTACLMKKVPVGRSDTIVEPMILDKHGQIYLMIDSLSIKAGNMVFIPGIRLYTEIDNDKPLLFSEIPRGWISLKGYDPVTETVIDLGDDFLLIDIVSGVTLLMPSRSPIPYCIQGDSVATCASGYVGETFVFSPIHPDAQIDGNYLYRFWWGDGITSEWATRDRWEKIWDSPGFYSVQMQVRWRGDYLAWSDPVRIEIKERQ